VFFLKAPVSGGLIQHGIGGVMPPVIKLAG